LRNWKLEAQIDKSTTPFETEKLQERLAKFIGGVALVHVGGNTETEMKEKKDRVDDALHATKCALEDGIVPGGGVALLYAREAITEVKADGSDFNFGKRLVYKICSKPFEQILINAGYDAEEIYPINQEIGKAGDVGTNPWFGFNIKTEEIVNMKEAGILDPTKVTCSALSNASSIASTILLTECVIVDKPEDKKEDGAYDPSQMMM
jgi:chaperonin GroEL